MLDELELDDRLSCPSPAVIEQFRRLDGDLILLGAAGKIGPSLSRMALRASQLAGVPRRVIAVSRFTTPDVRAALEASGVETIACDLLDPTAVARLPKVTNVLYLAGMKFGTTGHASLTWAMNTLLPAIVCDHFRSSRIVAYSTGNVYGYAPVTGRGSRESDPLNPVGEYAMSCVGRERVFEYCSRLYELPLAIVRLNYACEWRYGVLVDIATRVWQGVPVDVTMGHLNCIWQGDANAMVLQLFPSTTTPPTVLNLTGEEVLSVRQLAESLGQRMNKTPRFTGEEASTALLSDASVILRQLGSPSVSTDQLLEQVAEWVMNGGRTWDKPTHFDSRSGNF